MKRTSKALSSYWFLFSFLYNVSNMTTLIGLVLLRSFQFLWVLLYSQKGVNSPQEVFIHQASKVKWSVSIWEYLPSLFNKRQRKRDDMAAMRRRNSTLRQNLRLNADSADTASQKSLRQFGKYCWQNLNYAKNYIFKSNTFSILKFTFFFC